MTQYAATCRDYEHHLKYLLFVKVVVWFCQKILEA